MLLKHCKSSGRWRSHVVLSWRGVQLWCMNQSPQRSPLMYVTSRSRVAAALVVSSHAQRRQKHEGARQRLLWWILCSMNIHQGKLIPLKPQIFSGLCLQLLKLLYNCEDHFHFYSLVPLVTHVFNSQHKLYTVLYSMCTRCVNQHHFRKRQTHFWGVGRKVGLELLQLFGGNWQDSTTWGEF